MMKITFRNPSLEQLANDQKELTRKFGIKVSKGIMMRMALLAAVPNLGCVPHGHPEKCHELKGNRKGQFAIYPANKVGVRLVLVPEHDPVPRKEDGGIDLTQVTEIMIWEIGDYHDE
ncbi:killer suppression protein HigA [bacterium SCSIO 12827]|nr:killer suppression protein HigA [bacterium SCSIO 12827]